MNTAMEIHEFSEKDLIEMDEFIDKLLKVLKRKLPSEDQFFSYPTLRVELDTSANIKRVEYRPDVDTPDDMDVCEK